MSEGSNRQSHARSQNNPPQSSSYSQSTSSTRQFSTGQNFNQGTRNAASGYYQQQQSHKPYIQHQLQHAHQQPHGYNVYSAGSGRYDRQMTEGGPQFAFKEMVMARAASFEPSPSVPYLLTPQEKLVDDGVFVGNGQLVGGMASSRPFNSEELGAMASTDGYVARTSVPNPRPIHRTSAQPSRPQEEKVPIQKAFVREEDELELQEDKDDDDGGEILWGDTNITSSTIGSFDGNGNFVLNQAQAAPPSAPPKAATVPPKAPPGLAPVITEETMWSYRDPSGAIQGPFSNASMAEWHAGGYFPETLPLRRNEDTEFLMLSAWRVKFFGKVPFECVVKISKPIPEPPVPAAKPAPVKQEPAHAEQEPVKKQEEPTKPRLLFRTGSSPTATSFAQVNIPSAPTVVELSKSLPQEKEVIKVDKPLTVEQLEAKMRASSGKDTTPAVPAKAPRDSVMLQPVQKSFADLLGKPKEEPVIARQAVVASFKETTMTAPATYKPAVCILAPKKEETREEAKPAPKLVSTVPEAAAVKKEPLATVVKPLSTKEWIVKSILVSNPHIDAHFTAGLLTEMQTMDDICALLQDNGIHLSGGMEIFAKELIVKIRGQQEADKQAKAFRRSPQVDTRDVTRKLEALGIVNEFKEVHSKRK